MSVINAFIIADFSVPEIINVNPQSMLWLIPLVAAISVVYKTTKMPNIKNISFIKEVVILFGSIVVFMTLIAVALCLLAWLITE